MLVAAATVCVTADVRAGLFEVHTWQIDEHTSGILVRDSRAPVVYLQLEFPVGTWSRWAREVDLPSAMEIQIHDPEGELRRRSDALAATVSAGASDLHSWMTAWCLKEDLPSLLDLLQDILANERFDRKELKRWKRQAKLWWRASETDVQFRGRKLMAQHLFQPEDPRRRPYEERRSVEIDPERLRRTRDRIVRLPGRTIGLAGNLTAEEAEVVAAGFLPPASHHPFVDTKPWLLPLRPRDQRSDSEARIPRLTQVYFGIGREARTYGDGDYPAFVLANHVLGGHFYSRIMVALRHEGGDTYGAFAHAETGIEAGAFVVGSFTRAANAPEAEKKLRDTLRKFHEKGITEEERKDAVGYLTGQVPFDRQAPHQVLRQRLRERRLGLPEGFFDDVPSRAAALTIEEINAFIGEYYDLAMFVMGRVTPEK